MNYRMFWWNVAFMILASILFVVLIMNESHRYDGLFVLGMIIFAIALSPFNGIVVLSLIWLYILVYVGVYIWLTGLLINICKRSERFDTSNSTNV